MLAQILAQIVVFLVVALPVSLAVFVGRERFESTRTEWRSRLRSAGPLIVVLSVVLILNRWMRQTAPSISSDYGIHATSTFYRIEGEFILVFQAIASEFATTYFSFVYVYGYTFLLVFPVIAYFVLDDTTPFRRLLAAYSFNYAIGVLVYILVVAYGPRNLMPGSIETVLYDTRPEYQYLTQQVNRNENVFPSLHTSLATTVAIFAYTTREEYTAWLPVAAVLAVSVIVSTMYLGLHWAIDVIAGLVLAVFGVYFANRLVDRGTFADRIVDRLSPD